MSKLRVHAAMFSVAALFSLNYIVSKLGMRAFAPLTFAWLRVASAAILLNALTRFERLPAADEKRIAGYAILGVAINQSFFLAGLALTSAHVAAILITTIPVFALAAAIVRGSERATPAKIGGIALAAAGALLVVGTEGLEGTRRELIGALLITTNCLSYALYLVLSKPMMARVSARAVVARMFAIGAIVLLPVAAWNLVHEPWRAIPLAAWLSLAAVIVGPTVIAYLLQAWSLRHADSSVVAAYTYVQPVLATILAALFLGEQIRATVAVAAAMIFAGVALAGRGQPVPE